MAEQRIPRLTFKDSFKEQIVQDYLNGISLLATARKFGISSATVKRFVKARGLEVRSKKEANSRAFTEERRERQREKLKGKPSGATGKTWKLNHVKKNPAIKGAKNPLWKGGVTPKHLMIRSSPEYRIWREAVFGRDNWTCVFCGRRNRTGDKVILHADHIKTFADYPELRFDVNNGRTLCRECHKATDTYGVNSRFKNAI